MLFSVIVCTGLFYSPSIPKIPGIEKFPGRVLHSHVYRKPEEFANQTVVILGAATSGMDIVFELNCGVEVKPKTVYPLYNQIINVNNPSMGFVGLVPGLGGFCPKFCLQANYYISFLLNRFQLPPHDIVMKDAEYFRSTEFKKVEVEWFWDYAMRLSYTGAFDPLPDYYKPGLLKWMKFRENNLLDYKDYDFQLENNSDLIIFKPNETSST